MLKLTENAITKELRSLCFFRAASITLPQQKMTKYFRINTISELYSPNPEIVKKGYPYVWGDRVFVNSNVTTSALNILAEIKPGDIITAGRSSEITSIGKVLQKPVFINGSRKNGVRQGWEFDNADDNIEKIFCEIFNGNWEVEDEDIITVPVLWLWVGSKKTKFQGQASINRIKNQETLKIINRLMKESGKYMDDIISQIEASKNLIFTGAPGTGKTYLAKEIAAKMTGVSKGEQIGFVQFHPSYDYTDFVEGLRPKQDDTGNIGFERKDGVFKAFCKKALGDPPKKFVFIIDEINRGEISKIFGELFFSIDPGYRGEAGRVMTQYQNLITDKKDSFEVGFHVPKNVYIIGTMNDIDRSVESFDFAMRRRFIFKEITAEDSAENMKLLEKTKQYQERLNVAIGGIPELGSSYKIGAAYFLKKDAKEQVVEPDYTDLWNLRLAPLLKEYLRGVPDADDNLKKLKNIYELETQLPATAHR